jgi:hypothetical protein
MFVPRAAVAFSLLALSCDGDDGTEPRTEPDISAEYDVTFSGASGCDDSVSFHWLEGALQVAGLPDNLGWDFGETVLPGSVDPGGNVEFHGIKASNETSIEQQTVSATGVAVEDGELWRIEGDVTVESIDSTGLACTKTAEFTAVEEPPGE